MDLDEAGLEVTIGVSDEAVIDLDEHGVPGFVGDAVGVRHGAVTDEFVGGIRQLFEQTDARGAHALGESGIEEAGSFGDAELDVVAEVGVDGGEELLVFDGGPVGVEPAAKLLRHAPDCSVQC